MERSAHGLVSLPACQPASLSPCGLSTLPPYHPTTVWLQVASLSRNHILKHKKWVPDIEERIIEIDVACETVENIVKGQGLLTEEHSDVLIISVDAEGFDADILLSVDWTVIRPRLVVYEYIHLFSTKEGMVKVRCHVGIKIISVTSYSAAIQLLSSTQRRPAPPSAAVFFRTVVRTSDFNLAYRHRSYRTGRRLGIHAELPRLHLFQGEGEHLVCRGRRHADQCRAHELVALRYECGQGRAELRAAEKSFHGRAVPTVWLRLQESGRRTEDTQRAAVHAHAAYEKATTTAGGGCGWCPW